MPQAIGTWIVAAASYAATAAGVSAAEFTVSATVAEIIGTVALTAASFGLQALLTPTPASLSGRQQTTLKQPTAARRRYYGTNKAGLLLVFIETAPNALWYCGMLACHQIHAIREHWLADNLCTLDANGYVTAPVQYVPGINNTPFSACAIWPRLGQPGQAAQQELIDHFPGIWTSAHVGNDVADVTVWEANVPVQWFPLVYPGGMQNYRAVFDGALVGDPRTTLYLLDANGNPVLDEGGSGIRI